MCVCVHVIKKNADIYSCIHTYIHTYIHICRVAWTMSERLGDKNSVAVVQGAQEALEELNSREIGYVCAYVCVLSLSCAEGARSTRGAEFT